MFGLVYISGRLFSYLLNEIFFYELPKEKRKKYKL